MNTYNDDMAHRQRQLLDDLEIFLDARQAELLATLDRFGALRAAVIRRDEAALTRLGEQVREDAESHRELNTMQQQIERRLTEVFEGLGGSVTLSGLCACLEDDRRTALRHRQHALLDLARRVQNEAEATELLLRECARCNRLLLIAILGEKHQTVSYDPQGQSQWDVHRGFVSMTL